MIPTDIQHDAVAGSPRAPIGQSLALAALRCYKILISPLFAGSCRFVPSCSDYARDAILEHGLTKGILLAVRRLSRCHPLGSSGLDPVPRRTPRV